MTDDLDNMFIEFDPGKSFTVALELLASNQMYLQEVLKNQIEIKRKLEMETESLEETQKRVDESATKLYYELMQTIVK